jgi:activator of 2-hydroxyglutaryl-CoA dehydratase
MSKEKCKMRYLNTAHNTVFFDIDTVSRTTKVLLIDKEESVLWCFYGINRGNPVKLAANRLKHLYQEFPDIYHIVCSIDMDYGKNLFQSALSVDVGEVSTICHHCTI